jgi:alpha-tubulin suppressor-like RCC1 family protein
MTRSSFVARSLIAAIGLAGCGEGSGGTEPGPPAPGPPVVGVPVTWSSIAIGTGNFFAFACGLTVEGRAYCWGDGSVGQLGTGRRESSLRPVPVSGAQQFVSLSAGWVSACALTATGEAWCWGEIPLNTQASQLPPMRVPGGLTFRSLSHGPAANAGICALTADGTAWCWSSSDLQPVIVPGGLRFTMLSVGDANRPRACGVTFAGEVYCWTRADWFGAPQSSIAPEKISGEFDFVALSVALRYCGLTRAGAVFCGDGTALGWQRVSTDGAFASIAHGPSNGHVCALTAQGAAHCWGGYVAALGTGDLLPHPTPAPVTGGHTFSFLAVGGLNSCGVTVGGEAYCWGQNTSGQVGNGLKSSYFDPPDKIAVHVPTRVLNPLR